MTRTTQTRGTGRGRGKADPRVALPDDVPARPLRREADPRAQAGVELAADRCGGEEENIHVFRVPPGSGLPALLYSGKRVCRPPGGRGGAGEGYMGASDGALSPGGSIWLTSRPRMWPFGGVHVQSGVRKGPPTSDLCSTD